METSPAVEARIRQEAGALDRFFDRITSCRVVVEAVHQGHGQEYKVSIDLSIPNHDIVVNHSPALHNAKALGGNGGRTKDREPQADHKDIYVSIRDAFAAARRQLEDAARLLRGDVKHRFAGEPAED
jgi:ribosome-associated translation inhibitor RaiA